MDYTGISFGFAMVLFSQMHGFAEGIAGNAPESLDGVRRWPFAVSIQMKMFQYKHFCTGAIVAENMVATVAHCFAGGNDKEFLKNIEIVAGDNDILSGNGSSAQKVNVKDVIIPKENKDQGRQGWDIALLEVDPPFKLDKKHVDKIDLPRDTKTLDAGLTCAVAGWGQTAKTTFVPSQKLKEAAVKMMSMDDCNSAEHWGGKINGSTVVCAEGKPYESDMCLGDSGVPLVCPDKEKKKMVLTGVGNMQEGCGTFKFPGVYTTVAGKVADWMKDHMTHKTSQSNHHSSSSSTNSSVSP